MDRRLFLIGSALAAGCGDVPTEPGSSPAPVRTLTPWRSVTGGFLTPPAPPGTPPRPGTGMFIKLTSPSAIALRGHDLLVADQATQRLWRIDAAMNHAIGIAGAPVSPGTALAIGSDLSAWLLDAAARQVLRFSREGRLLQTYRIAGAGVSPVAPVVPVAIALADGGATLLTADGSLAQWLEQRSPGGIAQQVVPKTADERRIRGVDAIAVAGSAVFVLDRALGAVHRVTREGRIEATWAEGELAQPSALAADRGGRLFVVDRQGTELLLLLLQDGTITERWSSAQLGVQRIGGVAIDERLIALSDSLAGQVVMQRIAPPRGQ
jgi:hypothetical protein